MKRDFYSENVVAGRREHRCQFCPDPIPKGESHVYISMCSTGVYMMAASGRTAVANAHNEEARR